MTEVPRRGRLVLVGTPIGNREDLSPRAARALIEADLLLCEDTRSPARLFPPGTALPRRVSCFVANEHERVAELLRALEAGQTVAFVSEAGLPVWSDPGRALVEAARAGSYAVEVVPGPVAATVALALSGFEANGARFWGFLPRRGPEREEVLARVAADPGPAIVYEAGNRVPALLRDLARVLPDATTRRIVVARELTKLHEDVVVGAVAELAERLDTPLRGEVTLVLAPGAPAPDPAARDARLALAGLLDVVLDPSLRPRARAKRLAEMTGEDARTIYDRLTVVGGRGPTSESESE